MATYKYLDTSGVIVEDTSVIQTDVQNEYKDSFGQDLVTDAETPQGVLITDEVLARSEVARNNAQLANQINPNLSGGIFLKALCAFLGLEASEGNYTIVPGVTVNGEAGTIIPLATTISNGPESSGGPLFSPLTIETIGIGGTVSVDFRSLDRADYDITPNTLTYIINGDLGIETVTNPNAGIPGSGEQSDENLKLLRNETLALQGSGFAEAILSELNITPGVTSARMLENKSSATTTIQGVSMVGHSMYACVDGGTDVAIAEAITNVKDGGCDYNNGPGVNISEPITNEFSGQTIDVLFDRPNYIPVQAEVTVVIAEAVTDPIVRVKQAIVDYANGLIDGQPGLKIGTTVSAFEFSGAVNRQIPGLFVTDLKIKKVSDPTFSTASIPIAIYERATINSAAIAVVIT